MDLCHCANPAPEQHNGGLVCLNCRLWYEEAAWRADTRVKHAQMEARRFTKEQQEIVDMIVAQANPDDDEKGHQ